MSITGLRSYVRRAAAPTATEELTPFYAIRVAAVVIDAVWFRLSRWLGKRRGTLVYVGVNRGRGLEQLFRRYRRTIAIEANPSFAHQLRRHFLPYGSSVQIIHAAAAESTGTIVLNISNNEGQSSSIGQFDPRYPDKSIRMTDSITVPALNLFEFLRAQRVTTIDEYISDIQGMDLTVLRTLEPMIDARQIKRITCETTKDGRRNIYQGIPCNEFSGFLSFFAGRYTLVGRGWGLLSDGEFENVPEDWWEMDCRWKPTNI